MEVSYDFTISAGSRAAESNMSSSPQRQTTDSGRTPVPPGALPLESILCTEELQKRGSRPPDYEQENRALVTLARALADSPNTILQILTDTILEICQAHSAGISLLTLEDGGKRFYWPAISGVWRPHIGGGTPRDFGPCGDVLDRNTALLFQHIERRYTYFEPVTPPVEEALLVPFHVEGKAVGTLWTVAHDTRRKFDAEDERLLNSLGTFASSAYQVVTSLDALKSHATVREKTEHALRQRNAEFEKLAETLEAQVRARTEELDQRNSEVLKQSKHLRELSYRMLQIQDNERRHIARELHDSAGQILAGLAINLSSIVEQAESSAPKLAKEAREGQDLVRELSQEIRTTSYLLHPPLLDETGLSGALLWFIQGLNERSELDITLEIPEDFGRLSSEMELVIFRLVQECLTNVRRHSGSKLATIRLSRTAHIVSIEVQDQGKGIAPEKLLEIQSQGAGVGICGMRERVTHYGGDLTIESGSWGTKILVRVACENSNSETAA
jgi:signal transduction histidine kinase